MQINPIIDKELKIRMRGWKSPALISSYVGFLGLVIFLFFLSNNQLSRYSMDAFNPRIAVSAYNTLAVFQFLMILFITPAMTGGAISGERERQTLDLLLCTNFSPLYIILGKAVVSIAHVILLITASLPVMGMVFVFGGIKITDLLLLFAFYVGTAVMLASMGIFYSTLFKRSLVSMIMSYLTLLFLLFGTMVIFVVWAIFNISSSGRSPTAEELTAFMFANPLYGFVSLLDAGSAMTIFTSLLGGMRSIYSVLSIKPWMLNLAFDVIISVIFILLGVWRIQPVKKPLFGRNKSRERDAG